MSEELKIVLEDVKEKFDTVIEAFNMVSESLDRDRGQDQKEHEELRVEILGIKADVSEIWRISMITATTLSFTAKEEEKLPNTSPLYKVISGKCDH